MALGYIFRSLIGAGVGMAVQMSTDRILADYKKKNPNATPSQVELETQKVDALLAGGAIATGAGLKALEYAGRQRWADAPGDSLVQSGATILGMVTGGYVDQNILKVPDPPIQSIPMNIPAFQPNPPASPPNNVIPLPSPRMATGADWTNASS